MILACPKLPLLPVTNWYFASLKDPLLNQITQTAWAVPVGSPSSGPILLRKLHVRSTPPPHTHSVTPPLLPSTVPPPLIWVHGALERSRRPLGQSLFLFGSGDSLGEKACIRAKVLGVKILILLKNSWFEFLSTSPPHKSMEMKNLFRGEPVK